MQTTRKSFGGMLLAKAITLLLLPHASQALDAKTSYFGNSFPGTLVSANGAGLHVQSDIQGMFAATDGTCYANSLWDEGGTECSIYKNGRKTGACAETHGWGRDGGLAVAADGSHIYMAMMQSGDDGANTNKNVNSVAQYPAANTKWHCIRRYNLDGSSAPFAAGYGYKGDMLIVNSETRPSSKTPYSSMGLAGVAVDANALYVSDPMAGQVKKYSLSTLSGTPMKTWRVASPGGLVIASGSLYVIRGGVSPAVLQYSTSGTLQATLTFASGVKPAALGCNSKTGCLLVADQGPDQNIKEYTYSGRHGFPTMVKATFGTKDGIYAGKGTQIGRTGTLRFNNPTGVGADSAGNIYIAQDGTYNPGYGGGAVLESYTGGTRNWQLFDLAFVDCSDVDPTSESDVYTKEEHFVMDWSKTVPGSEAIYRGYTINRFKYPQDMRLHMLGLANEANGWVRTIRGHKFLVTTDMYSSMLGIFRFNPAADGECAAPSALFMQSHRAADSTGWPQNQPSTGEWIWRDANGNGRMQATEYAQRDKGAGIPSTIWGWWMDSKGDVWEATQTSGLRHFICQGLDRSGNPIYDYGHMATTPMPSPFNDLERVQYFPDTDTMYLTGYSPAQPNDHGYWKVIGKIICRYDHWSTAPILHSGYPLVPPFDGISSPPVQDCSFDVSSSDYLFAAHVIQNQVDVYDADTTAFVGSIYPGAAIGGNGRKNTGILGWVDIPYGIRAYRRSNGEYEIFVEDDWLGKVVLYRWTPQLPARK